MTTTTAATPLAEATQAWARANLAERRHADQCQKWARGVRCGTCLDLEAAQNVAAENARQARLAATAAGKVWPLQTHKKAG